MKPYTLEVDIDLPRARVIELFDDADNLYKWQNGLQSYEHLSGEPGQVDARSKMIYQQGKHRIELTETVTVRNLPDEFAGTYEWSGGSNTLHNRFSELGEGATRWQSTCAYEFSSLMLKVIGLFMPGSFRKQNLKFMENFKAFCEHGHDVRDS